MDFRLYSRECHFMLLRSRLSVDKLWLIELKGEGELAGVVFLPSIQDFKITTYEAETIA